MTRTDQHNLDCFPSCSPVDGALHRDVSVCVSPELRAPATDRLGVGAALQSRRGDPGYAGEARRGSRVVQRLGPLGAAPAAASHGRDGGSRGADCSASGAGGGGVPAATGAAEPAAGGRTEPGGSAEADG